MSQDFQNVDLILTKLSNTLGRQGAALRLQRDTFHQDGRPVVKVSVWLSAPQSEAELVKVLETGRRIVQETGTSGMCWAEISGPNVVEFCFAAARPVAS